MMFVTTNDGLINALVMMEAKKSTELALAPVKSRSTSVELNASSVVRGLTRSLGGRFSKIGSEI